MVSTERESTIVPAILKKIIMNGKTLISKLPSLIWKQNVVGYIPARGVQAATPSIFKIARLDRHSP